MIFIGANGSGKSRLGAWIEKNDPLVHRISAQRSLSFDEKIIVKDHDSAEHKVLFGTEDIEYFDKSQRWCYNYETHQIDDFNDVLSLLIAKFNLTIADYFYKCKKCENDGNSKPYTPMTEIDKLENIWKKIYPHRDIVFKDSKFFAKYNESEYSAVEMSDGERSVLYLISQVLCVPQGSKIIIDEPEVHLHGSVIETIWEELEKIRNDCLFIYITHNLNFAAAHFASDTIWVKSFNGSSWEYEEINNSDTFPKKFPKNLLFLILGNRRKVLFVEGEKNSWDRALYSILFPNCYVIACSSCDQVKESTKAFLKNQENFLGYEYEVYGLIDRDYYSDEDIQKLESSNTFALNVAEIENLFLTEKMLKYAFEKMCSEFENYPERIQDVKRHIFDIVSKRIEKYTKEFCKFKMINIVEDLISKNDIKENDNTVYGEYNKLKQEFSSKFKEMIDKQDYSLLLKIINDKTLSKEVCDFFGFNKSDIYIKRLIAFLRLEDENTLSDLFRESIPSKLLDCRSQP